MRERVPTIVITAVLTALVVLAGNTWASYTAPARTLAEASVGATLPKTYDAAATGINGGDLADTLTSTSIDMWQGQVYTEIVYHMDVTAGTTVAISVECEESDDDTVFFDIPHCTDADPSVCTPATMTYGITDASVLVRPRAQHVRCIFDDILDGTGTLVLTATASAP